MPRQSRQTLLVSTSLNDSDLLGLRDHGENVTSVLFTILDYSARTKVDISSFASWNFSIIKGCITSYLSISLQHQNNEGR